MEAEAATLQSLVLPGEHCEPGKSHPEKKIKSTKLLFILTPLYSPKIKRRIIMKKIFIGDILQSMMPYLDNAQLEYLKKSLEEKLQGFEIIESKESCHRTDEDNNLSLISSFIAAKRIEGCSEKSLQYYENTIQCTVNNIAKDIKHLTTDDLRLYLTSYQQQHNSSRVTIDNIRRILSSFFSWLEDEGYIFKSPIRRIHKVKTDKIIKETYTDEELETLRDNATTIRDLAIIDMLASTGMRIGEMVLLNRADVNFTERECKVLGKGNKERIVYFDARTKLHLRQYLDSRKDENEALFVSLRKPSERITIGGIESRLRKMGQKLEINKVHPHKFRRTLATMAIDKGMPIEQLQRLLGHQRIDTTLQYAMVKQSNVKLAHKKYIG